MLNRAARSGAASPHAIGPPLLGRRTPLRAAQDRAAHFEAKVTELSLDLDALLYSISHDLRAPLRAIEGFSEALSEEYGAVLGETGREYVNVLRGANRRLRVQLEGVLRLSRLGRRPMRVSDVDLSDLAESVAADLRKAEPRRRVTVRIATGIRGRGDRELVRELIAVLFANAWTFTRVKADPEIEFGSDAECFFVRDNGIGFDSERAENANLLFSPFHVLHPTEEGSSVGIGLAAAHRIVRRHNGRIWAKARPGEGATFYFTLPGDAV